MKIRNPYSKSRFTFIEKFDRVITCFLNPLFKFYIRKFGNYGLNPDKKAWYILSAFHYVAYYMKREQDFQNKEDRSREIAENLISMPSHVDLNLNAIFLSDLILIEDLERFRRGLKKVFKKYNKAKSVFNRYKPENIDSFCDNVYKSLNGGVWSPIGSIEIDKENDLSEFIESIDVQLTHISSSLIILGLTVYPSDKYKKDFKEVMKKHYPPEKMVKIRKEKFTTQWQYYTYNETSFKKRILEDYRLELKWQVIKVFKNYIDLYLTNNKIIVPSIESFIITKNKSRLNNVYRENYSEKLFFESIMFNDHFHKDISSDGYTEIYNPLTSSGQDFSLKIVSNDKQPFDRMYNDVIHSITDSVENISKVLLPVMCINVYTKTLSAKFSENKKTLYNASQSTNYKKILKMRSNIEKDIQFLKRINSELSFEIEIIMTPISEEIGEIESISNIYYPNSIEMIAGSAKLGLENVMKYYKETTGFLDDFMRILEVKNNHSIRTWSLIISTLALITSVNNNWIKDLFSMILSFYELVIEYLS